MLKRKRAFIRALTVGAFGSVVLYSTLKCGLDKFKKQLGIPTNVLEKEKRKTYIYLEKQHYKNQSFDDPNKGFLSQKARRAIKEILPAPISKFILLVDKNSVDLAEDYISPWSVLREAYSRNKNIRLKAVESIAAYKDWNDAEFHTLAQALDSTTCIGLARTNGVDQRLFLSPPALPEIAGEEEIEDMLRELLVKLPQRDVEKCIQHFTSGALNLSDEQKQNRGGLWCFGGSGINYTRHIRPQEEVELLCLQALVKHSHFEEHCQVMVSSGVLQLLERIRKMRHYHPKIQQNIVRIVSNICLYEKFHTQIYQSGWVSLLAEISKSPYAPMRIQASRGLANLDREAMKENFEDGVYVLYPRHRSKLKPEADIIFVHGLMGGAFYSWRQQDGVSGTDKNRTDCWPEDWLPIDLPGCRVMCVEYDTNLSEWMSLCPHELERRTISYRSRILLEKMMKAGIGERPIVWVAHSMGGLIIKRMLADAKINPKDFGKVLKQTKGIVFYSTPHFGSQLANYSRKIRKLFFPSVEVMELSHDSPQLSLLNDYLKELVSNNSLNVLTFGEMQTTNIGLGAYIKLHIVPPESADPGVGEFILADTNHLNICKPSSRHSHIYQQTVSFIRSCVRPPPQQPDESKVPDNTMLWS
ncbi:protein SERAC1-like isoform X2 [Clavelina lepadiformis]|uniref:Protein SERAC1 n=1 Tax=Clavelina lepadiformis TaxID=159417 RepID=A0ABP0GCG4_CLALP